jgi:hypothetical protein
MAARGLIHGADWEPAGTGTLRPAARGRPNQFVTTYPLDTDIAIEVPRGRNVHGAEQLAPEAGTRSFSRLVTVTELMFGGSARKELTACARRLERPSELCGRFPVTRGFRMLNERD